MIRFKLKVKLDKKQSYLNDLCYFSELKNVGDYPKKDFT